MSPSANSTLFESAFPRLGAGTDEKLLGEVDAHDAAGRANPLRGGQRGGTRAAADIEYAVTRCEPGEFHCPCPTVVPEEQRSVVEMLGRRIEGGPYQGLYYPGARLRRRHSRRLGGSRRTAQTRECNDRGRDSGGSTPTHRDLVEFPDPVVNYPHSFFPGRNATSRSSGVLKGVPQRRLGWRLLAGLPLPSHSSRPVKPTGSTRVLAANQRGSGGDLRRVRPRIASETLSFRRTYGSVSSGRQR